MKRRTMKFCTIKSVSIIQNKVQWWSTDHAGQGNKYFYLTLAHAQVA